MTLSPLFCIGLTIISLVLGIAALIATESWLVFVVLLVFVMQLLVSLQPPVKWIATTRNRAAVKFLIPDADPD